MQEELILAPDWDEDYEPPRRRRRNPSSKSTEAGMSMGALLLIAIVAFVVIWKSKHGYFPWQTPSVQGFLKRMTSKTKSLGSNTPAVGNPAEVNRMMTTARQIGNIPASKSMPPRRDNDSQTDVFFIEP